ncbi:MAG: carbohydrate ABC transporter permease [Ruminococcaceae bacterium]|nr:carbohydrate ABC transporter permease [Oscillospiraceae bacterium]
MKSIVNKKNRIKGCFADKVFDVLNTIILFIIFLLVGYPLLIVLSSSLSDPTELLAGRVWLYPIKPTIAGYAAILHHKQIWVGVSNSVFYTVVGTAINMVITVLAAYPLSRKDFAPRKFISLMFAFTMWFHGGLMPTYLLIRDLGMFNTRWALLIPTAMSVWNMIIVRTYFQNSISESLFESARLDGCDDFTYLLRIALPISMPTLAVVTLYYAVAHWNVFTAAYIYLRKPELQPLQTVLREILLLSKMSEVSVDATAGDANAQQMSEILKYSLVVVASIPMIILYFLIQKHFTKGVMVGSVKG